MWSDPIADMLTRIRNAVRNKVSTVTVPASRAKRGIAQVLADEGYITSFDEIDDGKSGLLRIELKYGPRGEALITSIQRYSKPGCRRYSSGREMPRVLDGLGVAVVSTDRGLLSDRQCREQNVGGEILLTVG